MGDASGHTRVSGSHEPSRAGHRRGRAASVLLVGDGALARSLSATLECTVGEVTWLRRPNDRELSHRLSEGMRAVVITSRDDVAALRLALLVEHLRPDLPLTVTIFDRTVAEQLRLTVPNCTVLSMADAVAPPLAARCIDPSLAGLVVEHGRVWGIRPGENGPERVPLGPARAPRTRRATRWLASQFRPLDGSSKLLLAGAVGVLAILLADTLLGTLLGEPALDALYAAVKTVVAVGPNPAVEAGPGSARAVSAVSMLVASVLFVTFTAGLVNRLLDRRLTGIVGARTIPRRDHVVVVGLGQVGLRLSTTLREAGVPVLAVERNRDAQHVRHAKELGIPVVIGSGGDRFLLQRLALLGARALAAVTSDDHENVAVCVAARAVAPKLSLVLRAGDGSVTAETRSLFAIGVVCDVVRLAAARLARAALEGDESAATPSAQRSTHEENSPRN